MTTMVKGVVLRPFQGQEGRVRAGDRLELDSKRADYLEKKRLFQPDVGGAIKVASATKKTAGGSAEADPTSSRPTGGRTGAEKPSSSSPAAPAPKKSRSRKRAAAQG